PAFVGSPKQGAAPQRRDYATASGVAGRPRAPSRAPQQSEERSLRAPRRGGRRFCPFAGKISREPPAPPSFGKRTLKRCVCRRSGGTGSGGTPDKCGGNM